ncbi:MAG: hypothetical protein MK132_12115 [Lentisphaerales bacterium]|nr:hypothetical protein [Lentisphaerales bacterium]
MSINSYLFKSKKEDIYKLEKQDDIKSKFNGIESNGIDPTTLTKLESILSGEDYYHICEKGDYSIIHRFEEDSGPIFISSSSSLARCLKSLNKEQKHDILEKWCQTQEMSLYGWTPEKAEHIIDWLLNASTDCNDPREEIILFVDLESAQTTSMS